MHDVAQQVHPAWVAAVGAGSALLGAVWFWLGIWRARRMAR